MLFKTDGSFGAKRVTAAVPRSAPPGFSLLRRSRRAARRCTERYGPAAPRPLPHRGCRPPSPPSTVPRPRGRPARGGRGAFRSPRGGGEGAERDSFCGTPAPRSPLGPEGLGEKSRGPPGRPRGEGRGGRGVVRRERRRPPPPPGSKDILFFLPRTKDNEERGGSGTYRRLQPAASRRGPRGRDAAALLALPAPGGRLRARPPRARFGQGSAARRHCPSPVAALRQLSWPRSVAPRAPSAPGPTWPPSPAPGAPVGPPRSERRGKRSGAGRRQRLLPRPSCAVCVRESLPSPLNSFLPSPPHNMAARSTHCGEEGAGPPLPPTYGAQRPPRAPPPPSRLRLRMRAAPLSIGRAPPSFDLPTPGPRAPQPPPPIGRAHRRSPPQRPPAAAHWLPPASSRPPRPPRARALSAQASLRGKEAAGAGCERPPQRRSRPHLAGASPAPPCLGPARAEHRLSRRQGFNDPLMRFQSTTLVRPWRRTACLGPSSSHVRTGAHLTTCHKDVSPLTRMPSRRPSACSRRPSMQRAAGTVSPACLQHHSVCISASKNHHKHPNRTQYPAFFSQHHRNWLICQPRQDAVSYFDYCHGNQIPRGWEHPQVLASIWDVSLQPVSEDIALHDANMTMT